MKLAILAICSNDDELTRIATKIPLGQYFLLANGFTPKFRNKYILSTDARCVTTEARFLLLRFFLNHNQAFDNGLDKIEPCSHFWFVDGDDDFTIPTTLLESETAYKANCVMYRGDLERPCTMNDFVYTMWQVIYPVSSVNRVLGLKLYKMRFGEDTWLANELIKGLKVETSDAVYKYDAGGTTQKFLHNTKEFVDWYTYLFPMCKDQSTLDDSIYYKYLVDHAWPFIAEKICGYTDDIYAEMLNAAAIIGSPVLRECARRFSEAKEWWYANYDVIV